MLARDIGIIQHHLALAAAADRGAGGAHHQALAVSEQQGGVKDPGTCAFLQRLGDPPGGAVDHRPSRFLGGPAL